MYDEIGPSGGSGYIDWKVYNETTKGSGSRGDRGGGKGGCGCGIVFIVLAFLTLVNSLSGSVSVGMAFFIAAIIFLVVFAILKAVKSSAETNARNDDIPTENQGEKAKDMNFADNEGDLSDLVLPEKYISNINNMESVVTKSSSSLCTTLIAGTQFIQNKEEVFTNITIGDMLRLMRELDNPCDANAVSVADQKGRKLGYIPRKCNAVLAELMDSGATLFATVLSKKVLNQNYIAVKIEIIIENSSVE
jgi:hypothetical protein